LDETLAPVILVEFVFINGETSGVIAKSGLRRKAGDCSIRARTRTVHADEFRILGVFVISANMVQNKRGIHE